MTVLEIKVIFDPKCGRYRDAKTGRFIPQLKCNSCAILIGPKHIETTPYHVGNYVICGWCYQKLQAKGRVELDGRRQVRDIGTVCRFLYPDGTVKPMKLVLDYEARFLPLEEPIPEGVLSEEEI